MPEPLDDLQRWMHRALLYPQSSTPQDATGRLVPNPRLSADQALAIYQQSYSLRIASCMREQYPALTHALGEELFNDFVADYVREAPPESYTLYDLGRRFASFLEANRPDKDAAEKETWIDFIVDLARFERVVFSTFDCPGAEGLTLATPATPDHQLQVQPSLTVGTYRFPVAWYYHQVREKRMPEPPPPHPTCVAVVRKDFQTTTALISEPHHAFLKALQIGADVATALSHAADELGLDAAHFAQVWHSADGSRTKWIEAGFFVDGSVTP